MHVVNFLPWREALYRRRRRKYCVLLLILIFTAVSLATAGYWEKTRIRIRHDSHALQVQAALDFLQQENSRLLQKSADLTASNTSLKSVQHQWMQQKQWQQLMREWQILADEAVITKISWRNGEFLLQGVSDLADPLRWLLHDAPQWQLEQIELKGQAGYQFVLSRDLHREAVF